MYRTSLARSTGRRRPELSADPTGHLTTAGPAAGTVTDVGEHYFSQTPGAPEHRRDIDVRLAGRTLTVGTAGGVFCPDHVDLGTRVLLEHVPDPPASGDLLDLGCGWGPITVELALRAPAAQVWALDVNTRALDLVADNARRLGLETVHPVTADQIPDDLRFAQIWSNPPIRIGKPALHTLLATWLGRLTEDGTAYLVVSRNLGGDSLHRWLDSTLTRPVDRIGSAKGFRVLQVGPAH